MSFAERENRRSLAGGKSKFRPQVKNKLFLLLALLLTAATGAWAQEPATTYSVKMKANTQDAGNWTIASGENSAKGDAADGLTGLSEGQTVTLTYTGTKKVIGVKAEKKAAGPVTYTELQGGEVLHVGDKITETYGRFRSTHHENPSLSDYYTFMSSSTTYEVLRADVALSGSSYEYTESPNGQYYVLKSTYYDEDDLKWVTDYYFNQDLPVTGTSDGITVTLEGQDDSQRNKYTFWVHEPNP